MRYLWMLFQLVRADFLERTRRYSFLVTLGAMVLVGYIAVPDADSGVLTVNLGNIRGVYNSAWIGGMIALLSSMMLSIPGFYLVKGAIARDRRTRVGLIIATTPMGKFIYLLAKAVSNFLFLIVIIGLVMVAAGGMQLLRGEVLSIEVWRLVAPFLFVTLPVMAVVAAIAVFFESVPFLRGGFGNIAYFVLYLVTLIVSLSSISFTGPGTIETPINDLFGASAIGASMLEGAHTAYPDRQLDFGIGYAKVEGIVDTYAWMGVSWTSQLVAQRLAWFGLATGLICLSTLVFERFDPAARQVQTKRHRGLVPFLRKVLTLRLPQFRLVNLAAMPMPAICRVFLAEMQLVLRGQPWWWYLGGVGILISGFSAGNADALRGNLLVAWIWPVLILSKLGMRERHHHMEAVIFSTPRPLGRQLPATLLAGVAFTAVLGGGVGVRYLSMGMGAELGAWCVAIFFVPALALAAGVWSGTSKLFEALYVVMWYLGPVSGLPELDFLGTTRLALDRGMPLVYLVLTVLLIGLACLGRRVQVRG